MLFQRRKFARASEDQDKALEKLALRSGNEPCRIQKNRAASSAKASNAAIGTISFFDPTKRILIRCRFHRMPRAALRTMLPVTSRVRWLYPARSERSQMMLISLG